MLAAWLNGLVGWLYISIYVMSIVGISLLTHLFLTPETRGKPLDQRPLPSLPQRERRAMLVVHHPDQALHDPERVFRTGKFIDQLDRAKASFLRS
jgi:hypothetical protein